MTLQALQYCSAIKEQLLAWFHFIAWRKTPARPCRARCSQQPKEIQLSSQNNCSQQSITFLMVTSSVSICALLKLIVAIYTSGRASEMNSTMLRRSLPIKCLLYCPHFSSPPGGAYKSIQRGEAIFRCWFGSIRTQRDSGTSGAPTAIILEMET